MDYKEIISEIKKSAINSIISEDIVMDLSNENNMSIMDFSLLCEELTLHNISIVSDSDYKKALANVDTVTIETNGNNDNAAISDEITLICNAFTKLSESDRKCCIEILSSLVEQNNSSLQPPHINKQSCPNNIIKNEFFTTLQSRSLQYSYIAVLIKALFLKADLNGQTSLENVIDYFRKFYDDRRQNNLTIEQADSIFQKGNYTDLEIRKVILFNPVKRSFLSNYVTFNKPTNTLTINSLLWETLSENDKEKIVKLADEKLKAYYDRISG